MKRNKLHKISLVLILVLTTLIANAQPTPPAGKKWVKAEYLSDEFNGTFDHNKWFKPTWDYAGTPCKMVVENSGVVNNHLWIRASLDNSSPLWFRTSRVQSKAQVGFPMYTECRIKAANISAYSTFWLNNGDSNNRNEIDICENNPKPSITSQTYRPYTMYSQYFIVKNGITERKAGDFDNRLLPNGNPAKGVKWNEQFQILGCYWKDSKNVQFYINGSPAGSVTATGNFTLAQNIIWDLWTGPFDYLGGLAIKSDLLNFQENTMYVDWIHTFLLANATTTSVVPSKLKIDINDDKTSLYPNPATNSLTVSLKSASDYSSLRIIDLNGKSVIQNNISTQVKKLEIDISKLKPGQYILNLQGNNGSEKFKFIKN